MPGADVDARMILVDANSWERSPPRQLGDFSPSSLGWTTFWGTASRPVRALVEDWVDECGAAAACVVFLGGHHPFGYFGGMGLGSLDEGNRIWLRKTMRRGGRPPLAYVSAHTHQGFLELREERSGGFYELNIQSVLDPAPGYRRMWMGRGAFAGQGAPECVHVESASVSLAGRGDDWRCSQTLDVERDFHVAYQDLFTREDFHRNRLRQSLELVRRLIDHLSPGPGPYRALRVETERLEREVAEAAGPAGLAALDGEVRRLVEREAELSATAGIDGAERVRARRCVALEASLSEVSLDPYRRFRLTRPGDARRPR